MIKTIGYILLAISCILFGLVLVVPWFGFSKGTIAGVITGLLVAGEILFYLSIFLIGKDFIAKIKNRLIFWKAKSTNNPTE
ncbi:MAG: transporter suffix domain-containing protein [Bacteroidales bacterium]|nr:transporter suffix domain-containing protein [Bacteroidales bacterium]